MSDPRQTQDTPVGRWRERRRAKRQQRLERSFFDAARTGGPDQNGISRSATAYNHHGSVGFWGGFSGGGDGGGCGGDGGGGGGC